MHGCRASFGRLFLLGFGLIFVLVGLGLAVVAAGEARAAADRAERLTPLGAAALEDSPPGREVLVEGAVSARNRALFQDMVAYVREEYRGTDSDGDSQWSEDERRTPPLWLDLPGGTARLADDTYTLESPAQRWQEPGGLTWNGFSGEGTKRYRGFRAGDSVVAIGTLVAGQEGPELRAEFVAGGTRASYIASQRSGAAVLPWIGGIFTLVGAGLMAGGAWLLLRGR
ncbi:MAG TPA: hypothetical protein VFS21_17140 [Roseiflexaceae bacterium]|nr:hypothetical protein [Roseiflexaceae bacterium]